MSSMSGRDIINVRAGKLTEPQMIDFIAAHTISHDFDVEDVRDLDYWILIDILRAWNIALRERALPQASGDS